VDNRVEKERIVVYSGCPRPGCSGAGILCPGANSNTQYIATYDHITDYDNITDYDTANDGTGQRGASIWRDSHQSPYAVNDRTCYLGPRVW
jgi:hypothetical protein